MANSNEHTAGRAQEAGASAQEPLSPQRPAEQEQDGRTKEWEDRARVNLEEVPEGTSTNIERDFEPETSPETTRKNANDQTAY